MFFKQRRTARRSSRGGRACAERSPPPAFPARPRRRRPAGLRAAVQAVRSGDPASRTCDRIACAAAWRSAISGVQSRQHASSIGPACSAVHRLGGGGASRSRTRRSLAGNSAFRASMSLGRSVELSMDRVYASCATFTRLMWDARYVPACVSLCPQAASTTAPASMPRCRWQPAARRSAHARAVWPASTGRHRSTTAP